MLRSELTKPTSPDEPSRPDPVAQWDGPNRATTSTTIAALRALLSEALDGRRIRLHGHALADAMQWRLRRDRILDL